MIIVTVELHSAVTGRKKHLGTAEIWNDATGTQQIGNYKIRLSKWGKPNQTWKTGGLQGFERKRLGAWDLLGLLLVATLGNRWKQRPPAREVNKDETP